MILAEKFHPHSLKQTFKYGHWYHLQECDSTQIYLKSILEYKLIDSSQIFALSTEKQAKGIGRGSHSWEHRPGGVAVSLVLPVSYTPTLAPLHFGNVLWDFLTEQKFVSPDCIKLKWPNDLFIKKNDHFNDQWKKLAGIITHHVNQKFLFGLGLNLYSDSRDLHDDPYGYLLWESPKVTAEEFINKFLTYLCNNWEQTTFSQSKWLERCLHYQKKVQLHFNETEIIEGIFSGLGANGECIINERPYVAGSLTVIT